MSMFILDIMQIWGGSNCPDGHEWAWAKMIINGQICPQMGKMFLTFQIAYQSHIILISYWLIIKAKYVSFQLFYELNTIHISNIKNHTFSIINTVKPQFTARFGEG